MKKLVLISAILFLSAGSAWAQEVYLWIGYQLPTNSSLQSDALRQEAAALSQRNIELQACSNGNNYANCSKNAEIAFRLRIAAIPGAKFFLDYTTENTPGVSAMRVLRLTKNEALSSSMDHNFDHLDSTYVYPLGVQLDTTNCKSASWYFYSPFTNMVCKLIQKQESASSMLLSLIEDGTEKNPPSTNDVDFLIQHSADGANGMNYNNDSLLNLAARNGLVDAANALLVQGAKINTKDLDGDTPLISATMYTKAEVAKLLIDHGADVNAQNNKGESALAWAAGEDSLETAQYLVENGADVNAPELNGTTPLMEAATYGFSDVIYFLLNNGASINARNNAGKTAMKLADENGHANVVAILKAKGGVE